jgi:chloramphenicol-sensitive protein RarD
MIKKHIAKLHAKPGGGGVFYTLSAYTLWGILPVYWKALKQIPAGEILAHRIFWSFLLLIAFIVFTKKWKEFKQGFSTFKGTIGIILGSMLIAINWLIYIWSVNSNHIVEASLGYYINPLFTIFLGVVVLRERPDIWQIIALGIAAAGVIFVAFQFGHIPWVALSLAFSFGLYGLVKKLSKLSSINGLAAETMMVAPLAFGFLFFKVNDGSGTYSNLSFLIVVLILLSGLVTSIPLLLFAQGAKRVSLTTLGFLQYLSPSISLILGIFLYRESFTRIDKISFGCIWAALAIYSFSRKEVKNWIFKKLKKEKLELEINSSISPATISEIENPDLKNL